MPKTIAQLVADIETMLPTNGQQKITAGIIRAVLEELVANDHVTTDEILAGGTASALTVLFGNNEWRKVTVDAMSAGGTPSNVTALFGDGQWRMPGSITLPLSGGNTMILADTRASAQITSYPALGSGGPTHIRTAGCTSVLDGGGGLYARLSADPVSSNVGYFQSADGAWWGLVPERGTVCIEQFGGKAEYVNTSTHGTDNYQPLMDAVTYRASGDFQLFSLRVELGKGKYWIGQRFEAPHPIFVSGKGNGSNYFDTATQLVFPQTEGGIIFHGGNTGTGRNPAHTSTAGFNCGDSIVEGFGIVYEGATNARGVTPNEHGIQAHCPIVMKNLWFHNVPGDAINIYASGGFGNANHFTIRDCQVHYSAGHGLRIEGGDANAGNVFNFYTHTCGKCGIYDGSYLGNHYFGLEIDGYGNAGVWSGGKVYQQIAAFPRIGVAPYADQASNDEWVYLFDAAAANPTFYPAWDVAHQYTIDDLRAPVIAGANCEFYSVYSEIGMVSSHAPNSVIIGGVGAWTQFSARIFPSTGGMLLSSRGYSTQFFISPGDPGYAANGAFVFSGIGGAISAGGAGHNWPDGNMDLQLFERGSDGRCSANYDNQNNITWTWGGTVWSMTGPHTTSPVGPGRLLASDIGVVDPANSGNIGLLGIRGGQPTTPGLYLAGSRYFTPSGVYAVSTTGGIPDATWASGTSYGGNTVIKTSAGRYYRLRSFVASTVEPTHTSGVVTETDGATWTYLASADATFTFQPTLTKAPNAYAASNVTTDRTYDANATTVDELADVLGTLIADLRASGLLT